MCDSAVTSPFHLTDPKRMVMFMLHQLSSLYYHSLIILLIDYSSVSSHRISQISLASLWCASSHPQYIPRVYKVCVVFTSFLFVLDFLLLCVWLSSPCALLKMVYSNFLKHLTNVGFIEQEERIEHRSGAIVIRGLIFFYCCNEEWSFLLVEILYIFYFYLLLFTFY